MIVAWKKALDDKGIAGGILSDLSRAIDCISHDLLITKLEVYGFEMLTLKFVYDYLKNRKQRTKINVSYSSWRDLRYGDQQGSILGPLFFNIFVNDIFYFIDKWKLANFADDNTIYTTADTVLDLLTSLNDESTVIQNCFKINKMKSNDDKCHLIVANSNKHYSTTSYIYTGNEFIERENMVELQGIKIDSKLNFTEHFANLTRKGNRNLHACISANY